MGLIAAMTKMTLIALVSTMGSVFLMFGLIILGLSGEHTPMNFVFVTIGFEMDVMLDTIFVSLSLPIHDKHYRRICGGCDSKLNSGCRKLTDRTTRKKEMELAASQQTSSSASTTNSATTSTSTGSTRA